MISSSAPNVEDTIMLNKEDISLERTKPFNTSGGFGDMFLGNHLTKGRVALKRLKSEDETQRRHFLKEAFIWRKLSHPFILVFLGVFEDQEGHFYLVSPLMEYGSLPKYLEQNPNTNRFKLIYEIAEGLAYLHSQGVIHGDIKGANVVISPDLHAVLCDFGLAKIIDQATNSSMAGFGSIRWQAPELFDNTSRTTKSDVYSFGITIAEILSGKTPFHEIISHGAMVLAVFVQNKRPPKTPVTGPTGDSYEPLWALSERCWARESGVRPTMREAAATLASLLSDGHSETVPDEILLNDGDIAVDKTDIIYASIFSKIFVGHHPTLGRLAMKQILDAETYNTRHLKREVSVWKGLSHPNIHPFLGLYYSDNCTYLVAPLAENGTLPNYLRRNPNADRRKVICEIADALAYVHDRGLIHGDMRADRVRVSGDGHALLSNFGLAKVVGSQTDSTERGFGHIPWMAPEVLENHPKTYQSDVYAFGMTISEILSGRIPFYHYHSQSQIVTAIYVYQERPALVPEISPSGESYAPLWAVAQACWVVNPASRPAMRDVVHSLTHTFG